MHTNCSKAELLWDEFVEEIGYQLALVKDSENRVRNVWALKMIAENVEKLDRLDREYGYFPLQVRPPLMLEPRDAAIIIRHLREACNETGVAGCIQRIESYFDGHLSEYLR